MTAIWSFPTRIVFGPGVSSTVGDEAKALGIQRLLIVTDPGVERAGLAAPIRAALEKAGIAVATYTGVDGNPTEENIEGGARAYAEHRADGVLALGGGSPMDAGKLIALRARCSLSFEELDDSIDGGRHVPADLPPIITIPTTAGTGSEVGRSAVVTVRSTQRKTVVFSPRLLAKVALLDPELTRSMPPAITAATGFDALTHCIEAYLSKGDHPMADAIALAGIDLTAKFLERAVSDGADLEARGMMMKAAMMGAVAFQKGLGACHSLAHPLSAEHGLHHGLANAVCLPAVLRGASSEPLACASAVAELRARVGLAAGLGALGIQSSHLALLADKAFADACHSCNPRACTRDDLLTLYQASL
jgi:alcohol dehydrogenase class IV